MNENDSAFPWTAGNWDHCGPEMREGFTKAEFVTAVIAAGLAFRSGYSNWANLAIDACAIADALIEALSKKDERVMEKLQLCPWCNSSDAPNMVCIRCGHKINADSRIKR